MTELNTIANEYLASLGRIYNKLKKKLIGKYIVCYNKDKQYCDGVIRGIEITEEGEDSKLLIDVIDHPFIVTYLLCCPMQDLRFEIYEENPND
jgi:hypothetical protein